MFSWRIYVADNNKTYLGLHVSCPMFVSDFNRICSISTDFNEGFKYEILKKPSSESRAVTFAETDVTKLFAIVRKHLKTFNFHK